MIDPQQINQAASKISSLLPPGFEKVKNDIEGKVRDVLMQQLSKLDLVTREEFDIQTKVLARTRAKLDALEKRINEMEQST
ncbi:MAG: accessory factor UbiK family protein [Gammaproteobacteria bacterium]|nr:accessory factor UbiK family protein [Gammaproteobacteria bacterium]